MRIRTFMVVVFLLIGNLMFALEAPVSLTTLADRSDRIVRGKVMRVTCSQGTNEYGDELIYTHASIRVAESLKGDRSDVEVRVEGGTINGLTLLVSDTAEFKTGEEVLVFLKKNATEFRPVGGLSSKYTITSGGKVVQNGRAYSTFRTEILRAVHDKQVQQ